MNHPVASAAPRIHGGTDALGVARFDFSTNSNACGPCPEVLAAVQAADATRYPDGGYTRLRQALADLHGVEGWRVVLAGSASEFIFRITAWTAQRGGRSFWTSPQAYGDYAQAAQAWRLQRVDALQDADLLWACEPSSPLGQAHRQWPQGLLQPDAAAQPTEDRQQWVLDCAYASLRLSGVPSLPGASRDRVWQLYSPNKALALTGVRAAYAIAPVHAQVAAAQLDGMAASWVVGAHGQAMLLGWTQPAAQAWVARTVPTLRDWKQAQVALLQGLGWECLESDANFFCARPPAHLNLPGLLPFLREQGIKLRDAASLGLTGWMRLSAQPPAVQQVLHGALLAWSRHVHAATGMQTSSMETSQ